MTISTRRLRLLRGNSAAVNAFTGLQGELVFNTTTYNLHLQDGLTPGGYPLATSAELANITANANYGNSNVSSYLASNSNVAILTTANITGNYIFGNGSQLTGIAAASNYGNANVVANLAALGNNPVVTTANITANFFIGNGSQLTGITAGTNYSNTNVAAYLTVYNGAILTNTINFSDSTVQTTAWKAGGNSAFSSNSIFVNNVAAGNFNNNGDFNVVFDAYTGGPTLNFSASYQSPLNSNVGITVQAVNTPIVMSNANIELRSNLATTWTFDSNGAINLANHGVIRRQDSVNLVGNGWVQMQWVDTGNLNIADPNGTSGPTNWMYIDQTGLHIETNVNNGGTSYAWEFLNTGNIGATGNIRLVTNDNLWNFDTNGSLTFPGNTLQIGLVGGNSGIRSDSANIVIDTTAAGGGQWNFISNGKLQSPNGGLIGAVDTNDVNSFGLKAGGSVNYVELNYGDDQRIYVDSAGSYIGTNNQSSQYLWTFDNTGNLTLPGNTFAVNYANGTQVPLGGGGGNTGNVTFNNQVVQGTGDENGGGGLYLAPGTNSTGNLQYLRVRGGDYPTHIHLDTGNNNYFDQYFGADFRYVKLEANGNILINADDDNGTSATWTFDYNGNLTTPGNITGANVISANTFVSNAFNVVTAGNLLITSQYGLGFTGTILEDNGTLELIANGAGGVVVGWDSTYGNGLGNIATVNFNEVGGGEGNILLRTGNRSATEYNWIFDKLGTLTLPGEGVLQSRDDSVTLSSLNTTTGNINSMYLSSGGGVGFFDQAIGGNWLEIFRSGAEPLIRVPVGRGNLLIQTAEGINSYNWTFGANGDLDLPGSLSTPSNVTVNDTLFVVGSIQPTGASPAPYLSGFSSISTVISGNANEGNITAHNYLRANGGIITTGNISAGNLNATGANLTGNINASYFIGNGSQLTGLPASYTNSNVTSLLAEFGSNTITTTGNISGAFVAPGANTQVMFNDAGLIAGNTNLTFTKSSGNLSLTGNIITSGNMAVNGGIITTTATTANVFNVTPTTLNIGGGASIAVNIGNNAGLVNLSGNVQGSTNGFAIGYRDIPQVTFSGNTTLAITDAGKHYYSTQSSNFNLTIPNNASTSFSTGAAINIINQGTGTITVTQGVGVTLYFAGNSTSGNRTLSSYGMATLQKVATDTWFIVGVGVT